MTLANEWFTLKPEGTYISDAPNEGTELLDSPAPIREYPETGGA